MVDLGRSESGAKTVTRKRSEERPVLGWSEYVALPEWGISGLRAKTDTGARTSALHVDAIEEVNRGRDVRFEVVLHRRKQHRRVRVVAPISRRGRVRSSNGHYTTRIFVTTVLRIGPIEREVEISLVDREKMIYRMLLGRSALHGVLIDVGHKDLLGVRPNPRKKQVKRVKRRRVSSPSAK